jgi:hypothetical protein
VVSISVSVCFPVSVSVSVFFLVSVFFQQIVACAMRTKHSGV